jgi:hypothetical protein
VFVTGKIFQPRLLMMVEPTFELSSHWRYLQCCNSNNESNNNNKINGNSSSSNNTSCTFPLTLRRLNLNQRFYLFCVLSLDSLYFSMVKLVSVSGIFTMNFTSVNTTTSRRQRGDQNAHKYKTGVK